MIEQEQEKEIVAPKKPTFWDWIAVLALLVAAMPLGLCYIVLSLVAYPFRYLHAKEHQDSAPRLFWLD